MERKASQYCLIQKRDKVGHILVFVSETMVARYNYSGTAE